jgi:hypothetical protein
VEKRAKAARDLVTEAELLEAERDGALAQCARLTRELREEKNKSSMAAEATSKARTEANEARVSAARLSTQLSERTRERDEARAELLAARADRDRLADELRAAIVDAEEAAQSRTALEEIHQALADARARIAGLR